jgi:hypothetical protein
VIDPDDTALITRLRDLALVDLDALLAGTTGDHHQILLTAHAEDLEEALTAARARAAELCRAIAAADPLQLITLPAATRAKDGGKDGAEQVARRASVQGQAARALARIDDVAPAVYARLVEADRRRGGG